MIISKRFISLEDVPVNSVNGKTGDVVLTAKDVEAATMEDIKNASNEIYNLIQTGVFEENITVVNNENVSDDLVDHQDNILTVSVEMPNGLNRAIEKAISKLQQQIVDTTNAAIRICEEYTRNYFKENLDESRLNSFLQINKG